jgi:hypothetical protein
MRRIELHPHSRAGLHGGGMETVRDVAPRVSEGKRRSASELAEPGPSASLLFSQMKCVMLPVGNQKRAFCDERHTAVFYQAGQLRYAASR